MIKFILVVREIGRLKPDYSLEFEAPALPGVGSYLSIERPDSTHGHTEDLIVRRVWWRLHHPETASFAAEPAKVGKVVDIQVECEQAIGPYSRDQWRASLEAARARGVDVEDFDVERFALSEADMRRVEDAASSG